MFFQIKQSDQVSEAAKANLDKLGVALSAQLESPDRIAAAIDQLANPSVDSRLPAARTILAGGNVAIGQLVAAVVSDRSDAIRQQVQNILGRMGPGGPDALRQLALYGSPSVRPHAITALGNFDDAGFVADWLTACMRLMRRSKSKCRHLAPFSRMSQVLPNRSDAIEFLNEDLQTKMALASSIENDEQTRTIWIASEDRTGVTHQTTAAMMAAYRDAVDSAQRLRRIGANSLDIDARALSASLAYRVIIDPDWGDAKQIQEVQRLWGSPIQGDTVMRAIEMATPSALSGRGPGLRPTMTNTPALIGLIRLIGGQDGAIDADALLRSSGSGPTALVQLASSSIPRVRYEAAELVSRVADGGAYPGISQVKQTLLEMTRLGDRPTAIIVETRPTLSNHFERVFSDIGWDASVVANVVSLERAVHRGGDIRMILSKIQLTDRSPVEMVDVVRRSPRGGDVPIVFYDDDGASGDGDGIGVMLDQSRWTAPMVLIDPPVSADGFDPLLDRISRDRRLPPMSILDRQRFRRDAAAALSDGAD